MQQQQQQQQIDLDAKILNIATSCVKELSDLSSTASEGAFAPQYRRFVRHLINYYETYNSCPSLGTLLEFAGNNNDLKSYIEKTWGPVESAKTDAREFSFLIDKLRKRYNVAIFKNLQEQIGDPDENNVEEYNEILLRANNEVKNLSGRKVYTQITLRSSVDEWVKAFKARQQDKELARGLMTGFSVMDYYTNGFRPGEFGIIAGGTGGGKSVFLINLAANCYMRDNKLPNSMADLKSMTWGKAYNVLYISLEMPATEVQDRIISCMAEINNLDITKGEICSDEAKRLSLVLNYWQKSPYNIKVVDMPRGCTMAQVQSIYDETCLEFKPDIVIIDYLGIMIDNEAKSDADWEKLKNISEEMHEFARANQIVVWTAVQLTEEQPGKGGIGLYRIGRSRMIAHNANIVLQIESREDEELKPDARIHCIKFRRGPKFVMSNLKKEFTYTRFVDTGFNGEVPEKEVSNGGEDLTNVLDDIFSQVEMS